MILMKEEAGGIKKKDRRKKIKELIEKFTF
jgi:hypothetical protein